MQAPLQGNNLSALFCSKPSCPCHASEWTQDASWWRRLLLNEVDWEAWVLREAGLLLSQPSVGAQGTIPTRQKHRNTHHHSPVSPGEMKICWWKRTPPGPVTKRTLGQAQESSLAGGHLLPPTPRGRHPHTPLPFGVTLFFLEPAQRSLQGWGSPCSQPYPEASLLLHCHPAEHRCPDNKDAGDSPISNIRWWPRTAGARAADSHISTGTSIAR